MRAALLAVGAGLVLASCGGGGGGSGPGAPQAVAAPAAQAAVFDVRAALGAWWAQPRTTAWTVGGRCSGTAVLVEQAPVAATFGGAAAQRRDAVLQLDTTDCPAATEALQAWTDAQGAWIGAGASWGVASATQPLAWPQAVLAGEGGPLGEARTYTDDSKTVWTGAMSVVSASEADGDGLLWRLEFQRRDTSGQWVGTEAQTWRISADGSARPLVLERRDGAGTLRLTAP